MGEGAKGFHRRGRLCHWALTHSPKPPPPIPYGVKFMKAGPVAPPSYNPLKGVGRGV